MTKGIDPSSLASRLYDVTRVPLFNLMTNYVHTACAGCGESGNETRQWFMLELGKFDKFYSCMLSSFCFYNKTKKSKVTIRVSSVLNHCVKQLWILSTWTAGNH